MKRPKLNFDILLGIVQEFDGGIDQHEETSTALTKFMLSGREPFNATLAYFSRAHRINFRDHTFDICVKDKSHCFGYDWILKEIILSVSLPSINHFCVYECPENPKGYEIMDQFLKEDLKHLTLFADLPWKYMHFFRNSCNFETVYSQHLFPENASLSKVFDIPSEEHRMIFSSFDDFLGRIPYLFFKYNPAVHINSIYGFDSLSVEMYPCVNRLILDTCDFSPFLNFKYAAFCDTVIFPNLIYHETKFVMHPDWKLDGALHELLHFPGLNLNQEVTEDEDFREHEGNISFIFTCADEESDSVYFLKETNPEIVFNEIGPSIKKTYEIGVGSFVHFVIKFGVFDLPLNANDIGNGNENGDVQNVPEIELHLEFNAVEEIKMCVDAICDSFFDSYTSYQYIFQSNWIYICVWPFIIFWYFNWINVLLFDYSFVIDHNYLPFGWFFMLYLMLLIKYLLIHTYKFATNCYMARDLAHIYNSL